MVAGQWIGLCFLLMIVAPGSAQEVPDSAFLIINQERLLTDSETGRALIAEEEVARDKLRSEARAIDLAFETEEQRLTDLRATVTSEEFRALADAFDERVVQARRDQDARSIALAQEFEQRRRQFYAQVGPILVSLMARFQARAIFDETSVLLADQALNITSAVITEIDATLATGSGVSMDTDASAPSTPADGGD
jgi:Skp family chaperone for outer membrane proteins